MKPIKFTSRASTALIAILMLFSQMALADDPVERAEEECRAVLEQNFHAITAESWKSFQKTLSQSVGTRAELQELKAEAEKMFDRIKLKMIIGHLGTEDRAATEAAWHGAMAYDWYGVGDTGSIAGEGPDRDGLYVWEDAQLLELLDVDTGAPLALGKTGDMVVTCLFKDDIAPCIRFNTHDITHELSGRGELAFKRIAGFKGRSDNMVKLRGINLFPHAIASLIENRSDLTGEYVCHLTRDSATQRDDMMVTIESRGGTDQAQLIGLLRMGLGVEVGVALCPPGGTAAATQIDSRQKPIRLIDERQL